MTYDPFVRGNYPVGVLTHTVDDQAHRRALPVEVWYPATDAHRGQDTAEVSRDHYELLPGFPAVTQDAVRDAAPRAGTYPLVMFSHGYAGHRRQSTFLCSHLASHGYVVASVDHVGNTVADMIQQLMALQSGASIPDLAEAGAEFVVLRPADVAVVLDRVLAGDVAPVAAMVDPQRVGMTGHSFGGWTTLMAGGHDRRIRAALPLAPAGGSTPLPAEPLQKALDFDWNHAVSTLYLVAEHDTLLPLPGMLELLERTPAPRRMVVLKNADHMHFCDRIEEMHEMFRMMPPPGAFQDIAKLVPPIDQLAPPDHAYRFVRGLGLAHMDAVLKDDPRAAALLVDIPAVMQAQGIAVEVK